MDSISQQIEQLTSKADALTRYQISNKLRQLAASVESPRGAADRHSYSYTHNAVNQIAVDLGIFQILSESRHPLITDEVADKCGADTVLTGRLLRLLAAINVIDETDENTFAGNETTKALASPMGAGGIPHGFYFLNKCFQELPKFLKDRKYQSPTNALDAPFQQAFDTKQHAFLWVQTQPYILGNFLASIPAHQSLKSWTSAVPLMKRLESANLSAPRFVDVGGGQGAQCVAFIDATKGSHPGKVILQDLPKTLDMAPKHEGVEKMHENFFEGQAIKSASFYYLRNVLHDYPDDRCLQILKHQTSAMGHQSILLIDELVLPNKGASLMAAQMDITMMATLASVERTEAQWRELLGKAGLKILGIHRYDLEMGFGVIEAAYHS